MKDSLRFFALVILSRLRAFLDFSFELSDSFVLLSSHYPLPKHKSDPLLGKLLLASLDRIQKADLRPTA